MKSSQPYQAGTASDPTLLAPPPRVQSALAPTPAAANCIVNVGSALLRTYRNFDTDVTNEQVIIRQLGAAVNGLATIEVFRRWPETALRQCPLGADGHGGRQRLRLHRSDRHHPGVY